MEDREIRNTVLRMLAHAVNGKKLESDFSDTHDMEQLLRICQYHRVSALASLVLIDPDKKWTDARMEAIRRTVLFDHEREKILNRFEEERIWYCPLKGITVKDDYPQYGIREMSDNDILVDENRMKDIRKIMGDMGYDCVLFNRTNHDVYHKEPVFNFEMHKALFNISEWQDYRSYYLNVRDQLIKDDHNRYGYHFSDEDFYIYLIAHTCKHLLVSGMPIRILCDIHLYLKHHQLDEEYIAEELKKLELYEKEALLRNLSEKVLSIDENTELNKEEKELLDYLFYSMLNGEKTRITNVMNLLKKDNSNYKWAYLRRRLFLSESELKGSFPFFYRHIWARPFLLLYRLGKAVSVARKRVLNELKIVVEEGKEDE